MKKVTKLLMAGLISIGLTACGVAQNPQQTGYYNQSGQWVPGTTGVMASNACITSNQQQLSLNFTAQAADFNGNAGFYAGLLPQTHPMRGQHGTVTLGGAMQQTMGSIQLQKQSQAGNIQMTINPQARTASGMIQISAQALYQTGIMNFLYSGQMNTGYNTNPSICVTSIALDVIYSASTGMYGQTSTGYINSALVYLYLNNGQVVPMPVQFF